MGGHPVTTLCDFMTTGTQFNSSPYYRCATCFTQDSERYRQTAVCLNCAGGCHEGHKLDRVDDASTFYCDCGHGGVFPIQCQRMGTDLSAPENAEQLKKDLLLLGISLNKNKVQQVISPLSIRACLLAAVKAFEIEEPKNLFAFDRHRYVKQAAIVCGFEKAPPALPFPCASMSMTDDVSPINSFVARITDLKITNFLSEGQLSGCQKAVVSALHFKGQWAVQFDPKKTKEMDFFNEGKKVQVPMMCYHANVETKNGVHHRFVETKNLHSLLLPYRDPRFVAIFTLADGFWDAMNLAEYDSHLRGDNSVYESACKIVLPKFKIESRHPNMLETLREAELLPKDFEMLTGIDAIIHAAVIEIDETGTEGAAATCASFRGTPKIREWIGKKPFLFAIRDFETGSTIFSGLVDFTTSDQHTSSSQEEACSSEPPRKDSSPKRQKTSSLTLPSPNAAPEEKTRSNSASSPNSSADGFNPFAGDWCGTKPQSGPLDTSVLAGDWSETEHQREKRNRKLKSFFCGLHAKKETTEAASSTSSNPVSREHYISTFVYKGKEYDIDVSVTVSLLTAMNEGLPAIYAKCFRRSEPHRVSYKIDDKSITCLLNSKCFPGRVYYIDPIDEDDY